MAKKKSSPKRKAEGETEVFHKNNVVSDTGEEEEEDEVIFVGGEFVKPLGDRTSMIPDPEIAISESFSLNRDRSDSEASYDCEYFCSRELNDDPDCGCRLNGFRVVTDLRPDVEYFSFNTGLRAPLDSEVLKFGRALVNEGLLEIEDSTLSDFLATCTEPGEYESEGEEFRHSCGDDTMLKEPVLKLVKLPLLPQDSTVELAGRDTSSSAIGELLEKQKQIQQGLLPPTALTSYQYYLLSLHEKKEPRKRYFTKKSTGGKAYLKAKSQRIKPGPKCFKDRMMEKLKEKAIKLNPPAQKEKPENKNLEEIEGLKLCLIDGDIVPVRRSKRHDKKANTETDKVSLSNSKENKVPEKCNKKDTQNESKISPKKFNGIKKSGMKKLKTSAQTESSGLESSVDPPEKVNFKENKEVLVGKSDLPSGNLGFITSCSENKDDENSNALNKKTSELIVDFNNVIPGKSINTKLFNSESDNNDSDTTVLKKVVKIVKKPVQTDSDVDSLSSSKTDEKLSKSDESFLKSYFIKGSDSDKSNTDEVNKLTVRVLRTRKVTEMNNHLVKKRVRRTFTKNINYAEPEDESKSSEESLKGSVTDHPIKRGENSDNGIKDDLNNILLQSSVDKNKKELESLNKNEVLKEADPIEIVDKEEEKENLYSNNSVDSLCIHNKEGVIEPNTFLDHKEEKSKELLHHKDCTKNEETVQLSNIVKSKTKSSGDHSFDKDTESVLVNESNGIERIISENVDNIRSDQKDNIEIKLLKHEHNSCSKMHRSDIREKNRSKSNKEEMQNIKPSDTLKLNSKPQDHDEHTPISSPRNEDILSPKICRDPRLRARMMSRDEELRLLNIKQDAMNKMEAESQRKKEEEEQLKIKEDAQKKKEVEADQAKNPEEKDQGSSKKTETKKKRKSVDTELLYKTPLSDLHSEKEETFSYNRTLPKKQILPSQRNISKTESSSWDLKKMLHEEKKHLGTGMLDIQQRRVVMNVPYKGDTSLSPNELYDIGLPCTSRDSNHTINYRNDLNETPAFSYNAKQTNKLHSPLHQPDYRSSPAAQTEHYPPAQMSNYYSNTNNSCTSFIEQNYGPVRKEVHLHFHQSIKDFSAVIQQIPPVSEAPCPASPDQFEEESSTCDRQEFHNSFERRKNSEYHYKDHRLYDENSKQFYSRRHERREEEFYRRDKQTGYHNDFNRGYDNGEKHYQRRSFPRQYWNHGPNRSRSSSISPPRFQRSRSPLFRRRYDGASNLPDYVASEAKFRRAVYTSKMNKFF